ncbi:MAG: hypothetical protein LBI54_02030 [Lachnospiraceae bacterium]|jgi:hypothetical protein|nr:hypothetical protein [Lachnospiraceae bacterium]
MSHNSILKLTRKIAFSRYAIGGTVAIVLVISAIMHTTIFAYGEEKVVDRGKTLVVTPIAQTPTDGYTRLLDNSELKSIQHEFDDEGGWLEFYVTTYSLEGDNGTYTLNDVAFGNAEMVMLEPKDSNGFFLREGETVYLYANLDLTPEYANQDGQTVQIGYSLNDVLYETFRGKLTGDGALFEITAPSDGEFKVFVINSCFDLQNYTELVVMLNKKQIQ